MEELCATVARLKLNDNCIGEMIPDLEIYAKGAGDFFIGSKKYGILGYMNPREYLYLQNLAARDVFIQEEFKKFGLYCYRKTGVMLVFNDHIRYFDKGKEITPSISSSALGNSSQEPVCAPPVLPPPLPKPPHP